MLGGFWELGRHNCRSVAAFIKYTSLTRWIGSPFHFSTSRVSRGRARKVKEGTGQPGLGSRHEGLGGIGRCGFHYTPYKYTE